ncbi:MAG TPA: DUF5667 domain-containing protein [Nocardioidaceae bacterium]|nr:DUF5667 domain-containing protein [Nocardioidaceae bacterium]
MTSLLRARKHADEFEALLNGSKTPASADLTSLVTVATVLREQAPVAPRPDFSAALRERLLEEAAVVLTSEAKSLALPVRRRGARERRLVAAATAAVFLGGTAGMAAASQNALPGDALYTIKRTLERAEAGLNTSDEGKGRDLLVQANDRLAEAEGLLAKNRDDAAVAGTVDDFTAQAQEGASLLLESFQQDRDAQLITTLRTFAADSLVILQELAKTAPPEAQEALANAARVLQELDAQALALCSVCADELPALEIKELLLSSAASNEVAKALKNAAKKLGADASATGDSTPQAQSPQSPSGDTSTGEPTDVVPDADGQVDDAKKDVKKALDDTTQPVKDLLGTLLPGSEDALSGLTDGLLGTN